MRWAILIVLLIVIVFSGVFMWKKSSLPPLPEIVTVTEMEPVGKEYTKNPASVPTKIIEEFGTKWESIADDIEKKVTSEMLLGISRWAKEQMKGYTPPKGWIHKISINPVGTSDDNRFILFFNETEKGFEIPSHSPIVFRRLMVGAVYDTQTQTISKVYVTIRGWKEE